MNAPTTNTTEHRVTIERVQDREGYGWGFEAHCEDCEWTVWRGGYEAACDAGLDHENGYEVA